MLYYLITRKGILERYETWAGFNNDAAPYDGYDDVHTPIQSKQETTIKVDNISNVIIVVSSISFVSLLALYILKKKVL